MVEFSETEAYFCTLPRPLQAHQHYFTGRICWDIPRRLFLLPWYRPLREFAVFHMGFSVVTGRCAQALAQLIGQTPVLEVMCGTGCWSAALRQAGVAIRPTDDLSWMESRGSQYAGWLRRAWVPDVESLDAVAAVERYGAQVGYILMSWPPQGSSLAVEVLRAMRCVNPQCRLLYLGEGPGGVTADQDFFLEMVDITAQCPAMGPVRRAYRSWKNCGRRDTIYLIQ